MIKTKEARSNNMYDVYSWIQRVIESCQKPEHCAVAYSLIENFDNLYNDFDTRCDLICILDRRRSYLIKQQLITL
jgi:translation initiation factor 2 alpha subunit (eIF-2alpha)